MRIFQSSNYDGGPLPRGGKLKVVQCASSNVIGGLFDKNEYARYATSLSPIHQRQYTFSHNLTKGGWHLCVRVYP